MINWMLSGEQLIPNKWREKSCSSKTAVAATWVIDLDKWMESWEMGDLGNIAQLLERADLRSYSAAPFLISHLKAAIFSDIN